MKLYPNPFFRCSSFSYFSKTHSKNCNLHQVAAQIVKREFTLVHKHNFRVEKNKRVVPNKMVIESCVVDAAADAVVIDNIRYELLTEEHLDRAVKCLCYTFGTSEPMGVALGHTPDEYVDFEEHYARVACEQGLGHVAIDITNGKLVGAAISEDYAKSFFASTPEKLKENKKLGRVLKILDLLHETFFHQYPEREKEIKNPSSFGKIVHLNCLSVYSEYRGRGIASQLTKVHLDYARNVLGYTGAVAECTGHSSKSITEQHHFVSKAIVKYSEYETNHLETGELYKPFEQIPLKNPKNDGCHLMWLEKFQ